MLTETFRLFFSSWFIYLIFGMLFGSFLNVVIYRVPNGLSIVSPPSSCPKCGHRILWYENIPVLSWIFLRGKCSRCKLPISIEYPIVEALVGLITLGLFLYTGPSISLLIYIPLVYTLFCIMVIDFKTYSIPHGLNITLFIICVSGVLLNSFGDNFTGISLLYSVIGGVTGFGILYIIQAAGKIIYKQDAVGMGDLFLLGSAGILLGPKLIVTAFILGSLTAVISYIVPSLINLKKRKSEALYYKELADKITCNSRDTDEELDLLGLRLQLSYNFNDADFNDIEKRIFNNLNNKDIKNITILRLFFRFTAVENKTKAIEILNKFKLDSSDKANNIRQAVNEDLIGYDSPKDNFDLLTDFSKNILSGKLLKFLNENKELILKESFTDSVEDILKEAQLIPDVNDRLNFFLKYNRHFQFNGYTAEQKKIIEMIEENIDLSENSLKQIYLSEISYVYFKDFFFDESKKSFDCLLNVIQKERILPDTIKKMYNISLFRFVFYKQRLAFGPFLAIGIMLSLLWGNIIISKYYEFLERMFL